MAEDKNLPEEGDFVEDEKIIPVAEGAIDTVGDVAEDVADAAEDAAEDAEEAADAADEAIDDAADEAEDVVDDVTDAADEAADEAEEAVEEVVEETHKTAKQAKAERRAKGNRKPTRSERARDAKEAKKAEAKEKDGKPAKAAAKKSTGGVSKAVAAGIGVAALVGGLLIGHFALSGSSASDALGTAVIEEDSFDTSLASYTYDGTTYQVTAEDVYDYYGAGSFLNDDGTYEVPSAENIISYVRAQIILQEANARGVTVTDEEVAEFATNNVGTDDYDSIAEAYSMDVDAVKTLLEESAITSKLQDEVVTIELPEAPEEIDDSAAETTDEDATDETTDEDATDEDATDETTDEDATDETTDEDAESTDTEEEVAHAEYAEYILSIVGDEWDSSTNSWADSSSYYAMYLSDFDGETATYTQASAAYKIVHDLAEYDASVQWTNFVNGLYSNADITLTTLAQ